MAGYYLKAATTLGGPGYYYEVEACVGYYKTLEEAKIQKDIEEMCWSDEGINYYIQEGPYPYWEVDNAEYDDLIQRVMK